ncbi:MAG: SEL1-like repeat protein, partial [bacterium]
MRKKTFVYAVMLGVIILYCGHISASGENKNLYQLGQGVPKSLKKAAALYKKSCVMGYQDGCD